jgi:hypothetical protein
MHSRVHWRIHSRECVGGNEVGMLEQTIAQFCSPCLHHPQHKQRKRIGAHVSGLRQILTLLHHRHLMARAS